MNRKTNNHQDLSNPYKYTNCTVNTNNKQCKTLKKTFKITKKKYLKVSTTKYNI